MTMTIHPCYGGVPLFFILVWFSALQSHAFLTPPPPQGPKSPRHLFSGDGGGDEELLSPSILQAGTCNDFDDYSDSLALETTLSECRGGASKKSSNSIIKGAQITLSKMTNFWSASFASIKTKISSLTKSKEQKQEEQLLEQLKTMPVKQVSVPAGSILPSDVVRVAVKRSGLIGNPLRTDRVQEIARNLKRWYIKQGYVLHSVTGATLKPETATAIITVQEPQISKQAVQITVCKEMVVDQEDGQILTLRQYKRKQAENNAFRPDKIELKDLNTTFVPAKGRTSPQKIATAMKLKPGRPFCWNSQRWQSILGSGVFSKVLKAEPTRAPDGNVCVQVYATEPPPRHLEYGIGKSLYTGTWEGEIDFEHQNLFGGGETVALVVRRGTKDASPSVRIQYKDDHFGMEGGHEVEVFTDFIGDEQNEKGDDEKEEEAPSSSSKNYDKDSLFNRRGATIRLKNPIHSTYLQNSLASISAERTSTRTGLHESLGSASLTLGPFRQRLPMDARSSISTTLTGGSRLAEASSEAGAAQDVSGASSESSWLSKVDFLPYSQVSATTRQVLPLASISGEGRKPLTLALQHILTTSTPNLPRHERKAMGISAQIRGAKPDGAATSSIKGTAELRVPFGLPKFGDASVVLFGDWFYVQKDHSSPFYAKSSIGVGLRKSVQGLPLKYDASYSSEGNLKQFFGLGLDFDA